MDSLFRAKIFGSTVFLMSNHVYLETADIETSSDGYASRFSGEVGEWFLQKQLHITKKFLKSGKILDVGGGHAQLANPLLNEGHNVTVVGSDDACKARLNPGVQFVKGDLINLPFPDASFDTVLSFRFISHCNAWEQHLKELARVAKTQIIIEYPVWVSLNALTPILFSLKKKIEKNTRTYRLFYHSEIQKILKVSGFKEVGREGQYVLPMALYRELKNAKISDSIEKALHNFGLGAIGSPVIASWVKNN